MARREFPLSVQKAAYERSGGICECGCGMPFTDHPKERPVYDHRQADNLGGEPTIENCAAIRWCCHVVKSRDDMKMIAKARRGEKKRAGFKARKRSLPGSRDSDWRQKLDGTWERRQ